MYRLPENEELLFHYLSGAASDEEKHAIHKWINLSKENKEYFEKVKGDYILMVQASRANLISDKNFTSILDTIRARRKKRIVFATITASLSCVIYFLALTIYNNFSANNSEITTTLAAVKQPEPIKPGATTAILQLSTGEQIDVNNSEEVLKDGNGTNIKINDKGEISYHTSNSVAAAKVSSEKIIKYNTLIVPKGGEYMLKLADGTKVWLNSDSELKYPVEFSETQRSVFLKGEAFFEVAHNKSSPFVVSINDALLTVLGTSFNVSTHTKASVEAVLVEGSIKVSNNVGSKVLKPSERGVINKGEAIKVDMVDVGPYIAWKNGDFVFHGQTLENIMNKLSLWYNVKVSFDNEQLKNLKLSGEMSRTTQIYDILYFFEKSSNIKFNINENEINITENTIN